MDAGDGSLRDAIEQANATVDADTITFDSSLTGKTIGLTSGELSITNSLTINGLGANLLTVDAQNNGFRVFNIDNDSDDFINVFINDLTITGGNPIGGGGGIFTSENLKVQDSIISGNTTTGTEGQYDRHESIDGGGINSHGGYLEIINTQIINNKVIGQLTDGHLSPFDHDLGDDPDGGGVSIYNNQLKIVDSTISDNTVTGGLSDGGAVYGWKSDITIINSTISGNIVEGTALGSGGGIYNRYGDTTVKDSTIADNSTYMTDDFGSGDGGGIFSRNGDLEVINSTVSGNSAYGKDRTDGGGIYSKNGNLKVVNSTISYNSVGGDNADGGGIFSSSGTATITNATISHNSAQERGDGLFSNGTTNLSNTIIANSINGDDAFLNTSKIETNVKNLIEDGSYNPFLSGDPGLGILQDNGGSTETQALLENSPAIDAGNTNENNDQRGALRDSNPDIGAFEFGGLITTSIFSEDFNNFTGSGFAPTPTAGQLDSDIWKVLGLSDGDGNFGGTHDTGDFARGSSTGGVSIGGIYAFDVGSSNNILGVQPIGSDFNPGDIVLKITNTTGSTITDLNINYDIFYNNNEERANSLNFAWSTDDSSYTDVSALDFTTPEVSDESGWQNESRSTTISGLNIVDGSDLYLRWQGNDVSGSGSRDEYGLDNILVEVPSGDTTAPTVETFTPVDDASAVAVDANLVIDFNEDVVAGAGNIVIKQVSDDSIVETIDVTSGLVTISNDTVTIDPTNDLTAGTQYYVEIDAGAIEDTAGNDYAGISGATSWNFTTASAGEPVRFDFNGDGVADIFWRHNTTGINRIWLMNNDGTQNSVVNPGTVNTDWDVAVVEDFTQDGVPDIFWRNNTTGINRIWLMNDDGTQNSVVNPGTLTTDWDVISNDFSLV